MNEEDDDEGTDNDGGNGAIIKPPPRFRIIVLSRELKEPPSSLSSSCINVWVSKAKTIYKNGKCPIVFSYKGRSEWLAKLEAKRVAAEFEKRRFDTTRRNC